MFKKKIKKNWIVPEGVKPTELDLRVLALQEEGYLVPTKKLIKTPEQIEGIRQSGIINTGVLDLIAKEIHEGMTTGEIDRLVYDYTTEHGATPATLNYEGFPKSVCTSINEVVCHGIPNDEESLICGDIINVDVSTIYKGYFSDASRMFVIGKTTQAKQRLVDVTLECLELGAQAAKPFGLLGDVASVITHHAHQNGFTVVRELCGHGVGLEFHEEPDVDHYGRRGSGMVMVPGMVFTIEPMINMGKRDVFIDAEDDWTVVTEDELPSAQWEHTFVMTDHGLEVLTA
ncbi:MAG: type I methionyl aminopeptidase [Bacteroidaceae bacterium]|nr:type I methionyl aminopeptidase [Bacteroidaceae bacterium]